MATSKTWSGTFTLVRRVTFSQKGGKMRYAFNGSADVYAFQPTDPRCKVAYAAVITGVSRSVMCGSSGDVGAAVLRSAGLCDRAKNSGVAGEYDTFPEPIGCPAQRLQEQTGRADDTNQVHVLTFYRKK